MRSLPLRLAGLLPLLLVAPACQHAPEPVTVPGAELVAVQVTPVAPSLARGTRLQLVATGLYSNGAVRDLTERVDWVSAAPAVAAVEAAGGLVALAEGTVRVTATHGAISGATTVRVTSATLQRLEVSPSSLALARGTQHALRAIGHFSDFSTQDLTDQVEWVSSQPAIVSVSGEAGAQGTVTAAAIGAARITARRGELSAAASVTVTAATLVRLGLTPAMATLAKGTRQQFVATGVFSDATTQDLTGAATWTSSAPGTAAVIDAGGPKGLVTAVAVGAATITAAVGGATASATVQVTEATVVSLEASPTSLQLPRGVTRSIVVTGTFSDTSTQPLTEDVQWTSADPAIAEVSNEAGNRGEVTPLSEGTTTVTARLGQVTVTIPIEVTPASLVGLAIAPPSPAVPRGLTTQLEAFGTYSDGSSQPLTDRVAWSSSDAAIAPVSSAQGLAGLAWGLELGTVTITARTGALSATATLEVTSALLVSLAVTPAAPSVPKGRDVWLTATGTFSDGSQQDLTSAVAWTSASPLVAEVSNAAGTEGLVTGLDTGVARVTATRGALTAGVEVLVQPAALTSLFLTPEPAAVALGRTLQLTAFGRLSDGSLQNLTGQAAWASSAPAVARVSNNVLPLGLVTSVGEGTTRISATVGAVTGETVFSVTPAELVSLAIAPSTFTLIEGATRQLSVLGTFSDASTRDVTGAVTWTSQNPAVATVSATGLTEGVSPGATTLTASSGGASISASVTVTAQQLLSITVVQTGTAAPIPLGLEASYAATGTYDNGRTRDLTQLATWTSSNPALATPNAGAGKEGTFRTLAQGQLMVRATLAGLTGEAVLVVVPPDIVSFSIAPSTATASVGGTQAFSAQALMTDGSMRTVTDLCDWSSLNPELATLSNVTPPPGLATAVAPGVATVRAECGSGVQTATLTVVP